jgi:hypothetical protein
VELIGTSEDLAIGMSVFFGTTGSREIVGELEGEGVEVVVGTGDALGEAVGIIFPESHIRIVFPLLFPLMQV